MPEPFCCFLGMPRHHGGESGAYRGLYHHAAKAGAGRKLVIGEFTASLLAFGFNSLWHQAAAAAPQHGITHFAMLHADIEPQPWWVDVLHEEMDRTGADILSVVVPIKSPEGVTSTAIGDWHDEWAQPRRLTMREVVQLPETFSANDASCGVGHPSGPLLVNTGCWMARRGVWWSDVCFTIRDRIAIAPDGRPMPQVIPEDWGFSRWAHQRGLKVMATRKVQLQHVGPWAWSNTHAWGTHQSDGVPLEQPTEPATAGV